MADKEERTLTKILKEYKEVKDAEHKKGTYNPKKAIDLLKEKNGLNASFEEAEQAYKDAGLYNNEDLHK